MVLGERGRSSQRRKITEWLMQGSTADGRTITHNTFNGTGEERGC